MRRKTIVILIVLLGIGTAVFSFVPVVFSPVVSNFCGLQTISSCPSTIIAVYKSPSCAVFGIGAAFVVEQGWYSISCNPRIIFY
jgi:hypothetical protein